MSEPCVHISADRIWLIEPENGAARSYGIPWRSLAAFYLLVFSGFAALSYLTTVDPLRIADGFAGLVFAMWAARLARRADLRDAVSFEWSAEHRAIRIRERGGGWTRLAPGSAAMRLEVDHEADDEIALTTIVTAMGREVPVFARGPGAEDAILEVHGALAQLAAGSPTLGLELLRDAVPRLPTLRETVRHCTVHAPLQQRIRWLGRIVQLLAPLIYFAWRISTWA